MTPTNPVTNTCLDAETLAAWVDGGLNPSEAAKAEAHVSSCPRCQEIAGLIVKTTPDAVTADLPFWKSLRAGWLVPLTAAVAAVGLWMIVPSNPQPSPEPPAMAKLESPRDAIAPTTPSAPAAAPESVPEQKKQGQRQDLKQEREFADRFRALGKDDAALRRAEKPAEKSDEKQFEARANAAADRATIAPAAPAAAPPPAVGRVAAEEPARQAFAQAAAKEAVSPDGSLRWRITDRGALEKSSDGGTTWDPVQTGITAALTSIQAPEPRTAIVTTADGRRFRTTDAGLTWAPLSP